MFTHCVSMNISLLKYSWTICAVVNVNSWARSLTVRVWTVMDWLLSCGTSVNIFNINIFNTNIFKQHCKEQFLWPGTRAHSIMHWKTCFSPIWLISGVLEDSKVRSVECLWSLCDHGLEKAHYFCCKHTNLFVFVDCGCLNITCRGAGEALWLAVYICSD